MQSTGIWLKAHTRLHTLVAILVFVAGLIATIYYWNNLRQSVHADIDAAYNRQMRTLSTVTATRLQLYENFLRGSAGLFTIHANTTQSDWDKYHQPYEIRNKFPDIEGVGASRYLRKNEVPGYLARRAAQGEAAFSIFPAGNRDVYVPVTFNAQYTGNNGKSRGYDGYTDPVRREAMDRAIATGAPAMSGVVRLVSESRPDRTSFLLYLPVYKNNEPIATEQQRKAAIAGFTYIAVDFKTLIDEVIKGSQISHIAMRIQDGKTKQLAYQSADFADISQQSGRHINTATVNLYGQRWLVTFATSPDILSARERQLPEQALWRGLLTCIFFAGLVWYLITDRERKYARQKQEEVQTAKDDLLSLASHQLRTPATVVKQYVGMLLQGYGGKVTGQQKSMLLHAYESNDRQLEIINQLLYVARLDAGRITLHRKKVDLLALLRSVARDQVESLQQRKHTLVHKLPKRSVYAWVDPHYMRMVLENLLSNAIKYTPEGGTITLAITRSPGEIAISVRDTGVGISEEAQQTIFEKFSRVENELSTDVNGSGVGLYLTRQIVSLHGGTIEVLSTPGQGATFIVHLSDKRPG